VSVLLGRHYGQTQNQMLAQHVVTAEDCSMGYRGLIQNLMVSSAWDMIRIALARRRCEDSKLGALVRETGRMLRKPFEC
jgi:hypothetical protein